MVARSLGFLYIWIDALCIVQDDGEDWAHEATRMEQIYAGASLTISTVASKSSEDGLFRARQTHNSTAICLNYRVPKAFRSYAEQPASFDPPPPESSPMYLVACPCILPAMEPSMSGPVHERGWTLQEQMMSTRTLYYGCGILWWECFELTASESRSGPLSLSDVVSWERLETKHAVRGQFTERWGDLDVFRYWQDLVNNYTGRGLTEPRDRLTAMLSLGKAMEPFMKSKFVAGVWSGDRLLESLCWEVGQYEHSTRNPQFPSWSWASVSSFVLYNFAGYRQAYGAMRPIADVVSFDPNLVDEAQTTVTGSTTLRGTFGRLKKPAEWDTRETILDPYRQDCKADPIDQCWYIDVLESDAWSPARRVRLLLQLDDSETKTFRRIGIGLGDDGGCFEIRENEVVVIV